MQLREGQKKPSTAWVHLRITAVEREGLDTLARVAKVKLSDYIRFRLGLAPLKRRAK